MSFKFISGFTCEIYEDGEAIGYIFDWKYLGLTFSFRHLRHFDVLPQIKENFLATRTLEDLLRFEF